MISVSRFSFSVISLATDLPHAITSSSLLLCKGRSSSIVPSFLTVLEVVLPFFLKDFLIYRDLEFLDLEITRFIVSTPEDIIPQITT